MIVLSPPAKGGGYSNSIHHDHGALLRTLEQIFGVTPYLGNAASQPHLRCRSMDSLAGTADGIDAGNFHVAVLGIVLLYT
jgi:hypothetical protein